MRRKTRPHAKLELRDVDGKICRRKREARRSAGCRKFILAHVSLAGNHELANSPDRDERNYNNVFRDVIRVIPRNVLDLRSGVVVDYDVIYTRRYTSNT